MKVTIEQMIAKIARIEDKAERDRLKGEPRSSAQIPRSNDMIAKKTPDEQLLDAELDFIMNAPQEHFEAYLAETGTDLAQMDRKAMLAFDRALESHQKINMASEALANLTIPQQKEVAKNLGKP